MSLGEGARTVVEECLNISESERVVVLNDSTDSALIDALMDELESINSKNKLMEFDELDEHGQEPPKRIADAMKSSDVFIAPTQKSLSHTDARRNANKAGARGATMPTITREIWNSSLQADYHEVKRISEKVYRMLESTDTVRVRTPSGTDLRFEVDIELFETDTGIMHEPGSFGNLPAGEADGATVNAEGCLVIDHLPFSKESEGAQLILEDNKVVEVQNAEGTLLEKKLNRIEGARNVAEFGFGTNPEAELIGNVLQDEKVLGTVHIAVGDNSSYVERNDKRRVNCPLHWDSICIEPTVEFDDHKMLESGRPVFLSGR